jgi:hypothetical protein
MILYCAADLIWASKIKATADALGLSARPVRTLDMLEARLVDTPARGLLVDLESEAALTLIERLRGPAARPGDRAVRIVAFGPHVAVDRLRAAKVAGADSVMSRGAINAHLPGVLQSLAGQGPAPADAMDE